MNRKMIKFLSVSAFLALPSLSFAASLDEANLLVGKASGGDSSVLSVFSGPPGLTGMVIADKKSTRRFIGWTDGTYVFIGPVFSGKDEITSMASKKAFPDDPRRLEQTLLSMGSSFIVGRRGPIVDMIADPNCIFCFRSYQNLRSMIEGGHLRLRVFPVAILDPTTSLIRSAEILESRHPAMSFEINENHFIPQTEQGGLPISKRPPSKESIGKVMKNTAIFSQLSSKVATPTFLYDGRKYQSEITRKTLTKFMENP